MSFDSRRAWGPEPRYPSVLAVPQQSCKSLRVIAGPCSIESPEQAMRIATFLSRTQPQPIFMRGGVYRAGTYPPKRFGLQLELLQDFATAARQNGLYTIVEVLDIRQLSAIEPYADAFQVGARHMQDYALLQELASCDKVVALKRHPGSTLDEFLGAAEYLARGSCSPLLIERGSSSFMNHVRWELSVSTIAAVKRLTGLPILVDASHGSGRRDLVEPLLLAGLAAGADGFLIELHEDPAKSISDADQAFPLDKYEELLYKAKLVHGCAVTI